MAPRTLSVSTLRSPCRSLRLFDRDLREAGDPNGSIAFFPDAVPDGEGFVSEMVFFPRPGVRYVVGVSHELSEKIGSYTISAVNDGTPVATSLGAPAGPVHSASPQVR